MHRISTYIRRNHLAVVALFFAVGGGTAVDWKLRAFAMCARITH